MPRRIYTYASGMGWDTLNWISTAGSFLFALGVALFVVNVMYSYRRGRPAGNNPWDAPTLEWATSSPPPPHNFTVIPTVGSRHPLWEDRLAESDDRTQAHRGLVLDHGRENIGTTALDAEPEIILKLPKDSYTPVILAVALSVVFVGLLVHLWWLTIAAGIVAGIAIVAWLWPRAELGETAQAADV
jgi:cytochrome c oxidase subunit 1/cytochrome c oxidase subunit I+III